LLAKRDDAVIEVLSDRRGTQPPDIPHPIGTLAPSYRRLTRLHTRHGEPFLFARLHIDERLSGRISKRDLNTKTALKLVADIPVLKIKDARQNAHCRNRRCRDVGPARHALECAGRHRPAVGGWTASVAWSSSAKDCTAAIWFAST